METLVLKRQFKLSQNMIKRGVSYKNVLSGESESHSQSSKYKSSETATKSKTTKSSRRKKKKNAKNKNIDKYTKLSDILIFIFHHRDRVLTGLNTPIDSDPDATILNEVKMLLLNIQEDVDHDDVAKVLIENEKHDTLIEML